MTTALPAADFLVEIGTEELPPKALRSLMDAFAAGVADGLTEGRLGYDEITPYASPRRLAVIVSELKRAQMSRARKAIEDYYLGLVRYNELKRGIEEGASAYEKAVEMSRSPDARHRQAAAYALGAMGDPAAIARLLDLATDQSPVVSEAALQALARLGGQKDDGK